jgi:hypothetical protein
MSTNSAIGVVINGKIRATYCHWDGYVDGVGKILLENYDQAKTQALMAFGSISSLAPSIGLKHNFSASYPSGAIEKQWTTFYERDRGDDDCEAEWFDTAEEFLEYFGGEYWYLLGTDGVWYVSEGDMKWKKVSDLLTK